MKAPALPSSLAGAGLVAAGLLAAVLAFYVWRRGVAGAAGDAGAAAARAAAAAAAGVVNGGVSVVSEAVGLPAPGDTVTDAEQARYFIDRAGYWAASQWVGVPALIAGARLPVNSGTPPPANSPAGRYLAALPPPAPPQDPNAVPAANASANPAAAVGPADLFDPYSPFIGA